MKYLVGIILLLLIGIQFIPYGKNHTNPAIIAEPSWNSQKTEELFYRACGDCHSHKTEWPWYSKIAPISWLIQHDVEEGRENFNVSAWGKQKKNKGDEAKEELEEGEMPPFIYTLIHSEAKLSKEEKEELMKGFVATFGEKDDIKKDKED